MFAELKMRLEGKGISFKNSSNLHGFLMETVKPEYAEYLHHLQTNPFSQCLLREGADLIWSVKTYTDEAYNEIIVPLSKIEKFTLKRGMLKIEVKDKQIKTEAIETMMQEFYQGVAERYIEIEFQTPTAFKRNGKYVFYPDLTLIFNSLMTRYNAIDANMSMQDEETLLQLCENSEIIRYKLRTLPFPMEGVNITGFQGIICIHLKGTDTMARFARLLFRIGTYMGVGIKTGLGMGAITINEKKGDAHDR